MALETPSDTVLAELPGKALKFVGAASTSRPIRALLASRGYTQAVHQRGWELTLSAAGYRGEPIALDSPEARKAIVMIDEWDEPTFKIAGAALAGDFPDQYDFVFDNLEPQTGVAAVVSVTTFLNRLDALQAGSPARAATHSVDLAALEKLATRGITAAERQRMRDLLETARGPSAAEPAAAAVPADLAALKQARLDLYRWYAEWREIAKALIKRRDYLVALGLASRKPREKKASKAKKPIGGDGTGAAVAVTGGAGDKGNK